MPQSLANIYIHLIFSTKNRLPLIKKESQCDLHSYMATVLANMKCPATIINSMPDHVHILFSLTRTVALAKAVEEVKKASSIWLKTQGEEYGQFYWQAGYGAFSVSESKTGKVANYIKNQEEHHQNSSFKDEYRQVLERHRIEYDERYVWD